RFCPHAATHRSEAQIMRRGRFQTCPYALFAKAPRRRGSSILAALLCFCLYWVGWIARLRRLRRRGQDAILGQQTLQTLHHGQVMPLYEFSQGGGVRQRGRFPVLDAEAQGQESVVHTHRRKLPGLERSRWSKR